MEPLESYHISLQNVLGTALCEHRCSLQWDYAIDMEETDQDSLASHLRIKNHKQLCSLVPASSYRVRVVVAHFVTIRLALNSTF
jgi:hypothetical protein